MPRLLIAALALLLTGCATVEPGTPRAASGISAAGRPLAGPAVNTTSNCATFMAGMKGSVTLDGQPVELRRVEPVAVNIEATRDNVMGLRAGRSSRKACGLWAWIPPLSAGEHELRIEGASGGFATSARYRLTVGAAD